LRNGALRQSGPPRKIGAANAVTLEPVVEFHESNLGTEKKFNENKLRLQTGFFNIKHSAFGGRDLNLNKLEAREKSR
jgi:hypothetical protein